MTFLTTIGTIFESKPSARLKHQFELFYDVLSHYLTDKLFYWINDIRPYKPWVNLYFAWLVQISLID